MNGGEWLRARVHGAPPHLLAAMLEAVEEAASGADAGSRTPDLLARAAVGLYRRVLAGTGGREDAFPLLAADALLTHAFEAQAELAPDELATFADRWGGRERLGALLP